MLQQILKDMYIDPELLAELSEHQKELLYVKMREEQVRRYKNREEEEKKTPPKKVPKKGNKKVVWLQGRDGCEWVWVMGHHKNDRTIEQILERENKEKARLLAEKEAQEKSFIFSDEKPETTPGKTPVCNQESTDTMKKQELKMKGKEKEGEERQKKLKEEEERLKKEEEKLERERKKAEAEAYASMKELRQQQAKMAKEEAEKKKKDQELKEKKEQLKREREQKQKEQREQEEQLRKDEEARREELYMSLKQIREEQKKASMKERDKADKIFQVQLRESKRADKDRSHRAKIAREEVRRSRILSKDLTHLTIQEELIVMDKRIVPPEKPLEEEKPSLPLRKRQAPRPPKPTGHKSVVEWFQKEECERQAGLLKDTKEIAPWFHGIITRQQAEYLLFPKAEGHFLVRVSNRIWGYALSFRDKERAKHFLIDASGSMYSFFGQDQKDHASLEDLVQFHMRMPISEMGKEVLKTPCVQAANPPDYEELFSNQDNHNTVL
ncbi:SH2 domain-containing protein 4A isoform X2 [Strongylocentrotus purpuratus]|uniref:SH2 domain-containing protein n=1 Tax=Strongylocentrotus purpuratus TaxID=7668 RepID=A0A7M7NFS6_STRPU|nr:SH2 domain-containing protein 4A isoform X2 [Strongylocentrotus purpuratus]